MVNEVAFTAVVDLDDIEPGGVVRNTRIKSVPTPFDTNQVIMLRP